MTHGQPWYIGRSWHAVTLPVWLELLARHRFAASPSKIPLALTVTLASFVNSLLKLASEARYRRRS